MAALASLVALLAVPSVVAFQNPLFGLQIPEVFSNITSCINQESFFSCENTTTIQNTCCSPTPGGLVLQTQFWDTFTGLESQGQLLPKGSWGIHGLWPDNCDGSFDQYCDLSRQFDPAPSPSMLGNGTVIPPWTGPSVRTFLEAFGRVELLDFMDKYWIAQNQRNEDFWGHEFSKHATCTSTFDVACYGPDYILHQDVVDFYESVIRVFKRYPTYEILATVGIVPSNTTTYTLAQLQAALKQQTGAVPYLGCTTNGTVLDEVWYHHHVWGTEQFGMYKSLDSLTNSTCNATGIWYYERAPGSEREVRVTP